MFFGSSYFGNAYFGASFFGGFVVVEPPEPFLGIGFDYTIPLAFAGFSIGPASFAYETQPSLIQFEVPQS